MTTPIAYEDLRLIWWLFLGVLLIGFAIMDGFDLGVACVLPFVARTDGERRMTIASIGPFWDGNQVWLILGAGAIFAAWPGVYATAFTGFYVALFLVLLSLIVRPVGFEFRNKIAAPRWRSFWDMALFVGGVAPSLVFGVAIGNVFQGAAFTMDRDLRIDYQGSGLIELLNPFGLMCGLVSLSMLVGHGAIYLSGKTTGAVAERALKIAGKAPLITAALFALAGVWVAFGVPGFKITSEIATDGPSNPLLKTVELASGRWLHNYAIHPWTVLAPMLGLAGAVGSAFLARARRSGLAFVASAIGIFGIVSTAGVSLFPFLLPSSLQPNAGLTVWDASSSAGTLFIILCLTLVFLPIVVVYTIFVHVVMRGRVGAADVGHYH